jgi:hypothetical protein
VNRRGDPLREALLRNLPAIQTEPLSATDLARWFGVSRNLVPLLMDKIDGVDRVPGGYRVPVLRMPPAYFRERGLLDGDDMHDSARICTSDVPPAAET